MNQDEAAVVAYLTIYVSNLCGCVSEMTVADCWST